VICEWVSCQNIVEDYTAVENAYSLVAEWTRLEAVVQISLSKCGVHRNNNLNFSLISFNCIFQKLFVLECSG
jgi:hypothetical protein